MPLLNFVSVRITLCLIIGILLGFYSNSTLILSGALLTSFFVVLIIAFIKTSRKSFPFFDISCYLTIICLGVFITSLSKPKNFNSHYTSQNINSPTTWQIKIREKLKSNTYSNNYIVKATGFEGIPVNGKLLLNIVKDSNKIENLKVDDELLLVSKALSISPPLNPHQFSYKAHLEKQGIYHRLQIDGNAYNRTSNTSRTITGIASNFRERLIKKLKNAPFGHEELGVMQALLLGQRNDISTETYNNYKNAGAVHILAVSGLHIGIILLILQLVLKPLELLPKGKIVKLVFILFFLWTFAFISGLSPSIFRAVMMFSFLAYAMYLNQPTNTFNILALSMFFILLIQPMVLFQVGFQMSYAAVFAIVWIYPKLQQFWYPESWLVRKVWQLLSVSCAAQLGVLPISFFYFHQFPSLFFISNLIIVPFLGIILGVGLLALVLTFFDCLPDVLAIGYNHLIHGMNTIIGWVAEQEDFVFRDISFDWLQVLLAYGFVAFSVSALFKPTFKKICLLLISALSFQTWIIYKQWELEKTETFILGHQTANTLFLHQKGNNLTILSSVNTDFKRITNNFKIQERIDTIVQKKLQNGYTIGNQQLYIIDSLAIIPSHKKTDYLLLTQSPKINLERLLDSVQPKMVLMDGSNYKSYINRWKTTCLKKEIPFHYTGEKGAFYFDMK